MTICFSGWNFAFAKLSLQMQLYIFYFWGSLEFSIPSLPCYVPLSTDFDKPVYINKIIVIFVNLFKQKMTI